MIDPLKLALLCQSIYAEKPPAGFDRILSPWGSVAGVAKVDGQTVVVFRGSLSWLDWFNDARASPFPPDPELGPVHRGFMQGVREVAAEIAGEKGLIVTGHSLGGARARLLAALLAVRGTPVAQVCVFGSPRPGMANVRRVLEKTGTPLASYANRNDPVVKVPWLGGLYEHTDEAIKLDAEAPADDLHWLRDHAILLYQAGLQKIAIDALPLAA